MIFVEITSQRVSIFRVPFIVAYLLGLALMQPWRIASAQEAGMSAMMLVLMVMCVAMGWLIGAGPTALLLSIVRWAAGGFGKRV
jgi:hypothetical protein